jgi:hypothetical protein
MRFSSAMAAGDLARRAVALHAHVADDEAASGQRFRSVVRMSWIAAPRRAVTIPIARG